MKKECLERMKLLKLDKPCIDAFKQGIIWESEGYGALYELRPEEQQIIDVFEHEYPSCKVYHVIHNVFDFGECYSLLYVDEEEKDNWEEEKQELQDGYAFIYAANIDNPWCSEFGGIGIKSQFGGVVRIS